MDTTTPGTIGKYQILRVLGRGGMGEVLLAQDDLGRRIAIKRPFASTDSGGLARFMLEAKAATLTHPAIPVVYEMGTQEENGLPFIAMEFVEGEPLDKMISSGRQIDLILKLSIIEQVSSGLGYAHGKGIIHRDIKPANIIVTATGAAKIIDFGIAKMVNVEQTTDLTQASQIIGSLHYIAPERFKAETVDGRADIFSAGVMLYLLLTGHLPFGGGEMTASYKIVNEAHSGLGEHIKDYPPALDGILDMALAKNPDDRFSTAEDFADALREVIDDLKRHKVIALFDDAERLTVEKRYDPALELLDEAMKLEPANTQVRKLRKMVREHQERRRRSERLKDYLVKADEHLAGEQYPEAVAVLKEAARADPSSTEVRDRLVFVEDKKRRYDMAAAALTDAEAARNRGDITAALRIAEKAVEQDPENTKLLAVRGAIAKQLEREALQVKVVSVLDAARRELSAQNFPAMEALLAEAETLDSSHPQIEQMRGELARVREAEERRQLIEEIQRRVNDFLRTDNYDQASELLTRAIEKLPSETTLHRLKMEVDAASRKFDSKQMVDSAIATAKHTFASDPQAALAGLHDAIEQMPGEERLIDYERALRQQADVLRAQQLLSDALRNAREFIAARQPDKAVGALEAYELEHGNQADVGELLKYARKELAEQQVRSITERTLAQARSLRDERPDEAIRVLEAALKEPAVQASGDTSLARLLEDVREQQAAVARKLDVVQKRAALLRERGQVDEAIAVLKEFLASGAKSTAAQEMLNSLQAEAEIRQITAKALSSAAAAAEQGKFPAAFDALQSVVRAYGESDELTRATEQVKAVRALYAQQVITKSIETSRAALLANDVPGAMAALRAANEMVEYADAAKQADWRRIGQAAKKAEAEPPAAGAVIADPLGDLAEAETQKRTSPAVLYGGIAVVCALLGVVGFMVMRKPAGGPVGPTDARINIIKAQPGAMVSIDGGAAKATDATGALAITVQPGSHRIDVKMDGYEPFTDTVQLVAGDILKEPVPRVKVVAASKAGTLVMQENLPAFKLMVDGQPRGTMKKDGTLTLEEGPHKIVYSNDDGTDRQEHDIMIVAGKSLPDSFTLRAAAVLPPPTPPKSNSPSPPAMGSLVVETTPNAQVAIDGQPKGSADGSGRLTVGSLSAGNHSVEISLDKYQPLSGRSVTVAAGQPARFAQPLTPLPPAPPSTGSLSLQTSAQAQISIDGQRKGMADGSGQFNLDGLSPGSHAVEVSLDHFQPNQASFSVRAGSPSFVSVKLQPEVVVVNTPKPVAPTPSAAPDNSADFAGIQQALHNFEQAWGSKNMGRIKSTWIDVDNGGRGKKFADLLQGARVAIIHESCEGQPAINGNTATQKCMETSQIDKDPPHTNPKAMTFTKTGGKWVMKDKTP
jgi:tRNA A-37 threonylcarbamoyl transferase component Bud32/tetratricopeptide (TPR) repeat protein